MMNRLLVAGRPHRIALIALALCGGCAAWDVEKLTLPSSPGAPDIHPIRKERATEAVRRFDAERNKAQYEAAASAWRQGDFEGCRQALEKILLRTPKHRESLLLLAEIDLEQDRPSEAVEHLRTAVAEHPQDAEVAYKLGLALEADHQASEALHYFQLAAQLAPNETKYAEAYEFAETHLDDENTPADALEPAESPAFSELAVDERPIATTEPVDPPAVPAMLPAETFAGDAARAGEEFAELLATRDTIDSQTFARALGKFLAKEPRHIEAGIMQAEIDLENDRGAAARERMERMVIRYPHDAQVRRACGLVYEALGANDRAAICFARADELEFGAPPAESTIATVAFERNSADFGSVAAPEEVPPEVPTVESLPQEELPSIATTSSDEVFAESLSAKQHMDRGAALLKAGQVQTAHEEFFAAIALEPENMKLYTEGALKALQAEQSELAAEIARTGTARFPNSAGLHRLHGGAALRLQRYAEAEAALRQSLSLDNSQALTYFLLGSALERLGKSESARWHLSQAARLDGRYAVRR